MPFLVGKAGVKSTTYYVGVCLSSFQLIQGQEGSGLAGREKASTAVTSAPNSDLVFLASPVPQHSLFSALHKSHPLQHHITPPSESSIGFLCHLE